MSWRPTAVVIAATLLALAPAKLRAQPKPADSGAPTQPPPPELASPEGPDTSEPTPKKRTLPVIHHAPPSVARAHEPVTIHARIDHPQLVKRAFVLYRAAGAKRFEEVAFRRGSPGPYVAIIPAKHVSGPWVDYTIEVEHLDAQRSPAFSSRAAPHRVQVPDDGMDLIENALEKKLDGRRSVFSSRAEYVSFGKSVGEVIENGVVSQHEVDDRYYRVEAAYTYRPMRVISEFSIRGGVVRGRSPVGDRDLQPGQAEDERFDVGLNYGAPSVRFRFHDNWHLDGSFLLSVTELGFSVGTGAALHIGDPYGTKLTLGFEAIQEFGSRFYSQIDIQAHERIKISPIVEVTNMPSADNFGVRLIGEVGANLGAGFSLAARGGYQARVFTSGGPSFGGMLGYAF